MSNKILQIQKGEVENSSLNININKKYFQDLPFWIWDIQIARQQIIRKLTIIFNLKIDENLISLGFDENYIEQSAEKLLKYHQEIPDKNDRYNDGVDCNHLICCFNHVVGLPRTHFDGRRRPLYDFQKQIFDSIRNNLITAILKAKKLGVTELVLRIILYVCICLAHHYVTLGNQILIVTGVRLELAKVHLDRMVNMLPRYIKKLFVSKYIENQLIVNDIIISIFPSKNIKDLVGLTNVILIFVDEADFFARSQTFEINDTIIPYADILKTHIIMVSTPNLPHQYFYKIFVTSRNNEKLKLEYSKINKLEYDYHWGLNRVYPYDFEETELTKSYAKRAYLLMFAGEIGNAFNDSWIENAIKLGEKYSYIFDSIDEYHRVFVGEDSGYSTGLEDGARCARTIGQLRMIEDKEKGIRKKLCFIYQSQEEDEKTLALDFAKSGLETYRKYGKNTRFFIDGSDKNYIKTLKIKLMEDINYENIPKEDFNHRNYIALPVYTSSKESQKLREMYLNAKYHLSNGNIALHPKNCDHLINALYSANVENDVLQKEKITNNHALDSFLLMLEGYKVGQKKNNI